MDLRNQNSTQHKGFGSAMLWPGVYYAVKMPMNQIDNTQSEYESCTTHNQLYYISQMGSTKSQNHIQLQSFVSVNASFYGP
jgi:hypothetical protein